VSGNASFQAGNGQAIGDSMLLVDSNTAVDLPFPDLCSLDLSFGTDFV
jgi:hypothetical protein